MQQSSEFGHFFGHLGQNDFINYAFNVLNFKPFICSPNKARTCFNPLSLKIKLIIINSLSLIVTHYLEGLILRRGLVIKYISILLHRSHPVLCGLI